MTNKFPILTGLLAEFATIMEQHINPQNTATESAPTGETQAPATPRRGRPPKETPAASAEPEKPAAAPVTGAKTEAELRELIKPLIEDQGRGAEVKAILSKLGANKLSELAPEKHAEFVRSIEALLI